MTNIEIFTDKNKILNYFFLYLCINDNIYKIDKDFVYDSQNSNFHAAHHIYSRMR